MKLTSLRQRMGARILVTALASAVAVALISLALRTEQHHDENAIDDENAIVGLSSPPPQNELKELEAAAEAGNPEAQAKLAHEISLYQGYGIRAFRLIQQAAYQGHPYSEYEMGEMLSEENMVWERDSSEIAKLRTAPPDDVTWTEGLGGEGIKLAIDHTKALHWFEKAAEHGVHWAWWRLANIYKEGRGVNPDPVESAKWVRKLANVGSPGDILDYARRLDVGEGVTPDPIEALAWSLLVIESAYPAGSAIGSKARTIQRDLERKLSSDEISTARTRAKELAKHTSVCVGGLENCQ